ncbi:hypothetical protein HXX02_07440 [Microbulbifer elongatus]|uniref:DUF4190 domain-containing protein n=1 Tax=Microbulbifer elongatus TaxID=86173 RepID=A0ABT1NZH8_9GAMM|nr:hypothetical protein [Microbulbifer elongatus]MCQ3829275.1 hypothetical protein [Microbulbifer elongatus]
MKVSIIKDHIVGGVSYFVLSMAIAMLFLNTLSTEDEAIRLLGKSFLLALGYYAAVAGPLVAYGKGCQKQDGKGWRATFAVVYVVYSALFIGIVSLVAYIAFSS